jgi:hypothetical protein
LTFRIDGHTFYQLTFTKTSRTWVFDTQTEGWSEFLEWGGDWERHRAECAIYANGRLLIGDRSNGKLYELRSDAYSNDGRPLRALRASAYVADGTANLTVGMFEVLCEPGVGVTTGQGQDPQMMLRVSKDGAATFSPMLTRTMGSKGQYRGRTRFARPVGNGHSFVFEVSITDPVKRVILGASINGD